MINKTQPIWRVLTAVLASVGLLLASHGVEAKSRQATASKKVVASKKAGKQKYASYRKASGRDRLAKASRHSRQLASRAARRQAALARYEPARLQRVSWAPSMASDLDGPHLVANTALAYNEETRAVDFSKNTQQQVSIASITKVMTAMVILDSKLDLDEVITITQEDVINSEGTRSRLQPGFGLTRGELIKVAMLVSDNRAAVALGRTYPGGMDAFVARMNRKARSIGMTDSQFVEPSGLSPENKALPTDIVRMVEAAHEYPLLRAVSSTIEAEILPFGSDMPLTFRNTNQLVRDPEWQIGLSKTGYISRAGHCLVMHTRIANKPYVLVIMDSSGNRSREADAARIKRWLEFKAGIHSSSS